MRNKEKVKSKKMGRKGNAHKAISKEQIAKREEFTGKHQEKICEDENYFDYEAGVGRMEDER